VFYIVLVIHGNCWHHRVVLSPFSAWNRGNPIVIAGSSPARDHRRVAVRRWGIPSSRRRGIPAAVPGDEAPSATSSQAST